jgi:hypothetical protein
MQYIFILKITHLRKINQVSHKSHHNSNQELNLNHTKMTKNNTNNTNYLKNNPPKTSKPFFNPIFFQKSYLY